MKTDNKKDKKEFWTLRKIYILEGLFLLSLVILWFVLPNILENMQLSISALFA